MSLVGLCGEKCIEQNGAFNYFCERKKEGFFGLKKSTDICKECENALKECSKKEKEEKEEEPHETITILCDMVAKLHTELYHAKNDIGALLFLNGNCEYCANGQVEKYCGAERWSCKLGNGIDCKPVWRGVVKESDEE